jgi:exopolysaccharide biosynthesis polyprenyl glycosylphosphotransferase
LYLSYRGVSRLLFVLFSTLAFAMLVAWRIAYRGAYHLGILRTVEPRNVLIVGAGELGREVERNILAYHSLGLRLAGFLDDAKNKTGAPNIIGALDAARTAVEAMDIDEVVIALPPRAYEKVFRLVAELHTLPVKVWVIPDYFNLALHKTVLAEFAGIPMLDLRAPALSETQRLVKRIFDLSLTLLALPACLPMMAGIALAIRREDGGPVFFRQARVGENGRVFHILKFRTMITEAEAMRHIIEQQDEEGNLIHKTADDPRVTRVGRFLRRSSLDELPQMINILRGEMSWVGPRPELPYLVDRYEPWQRKRFSVPQGLTGWWQVNGRSDKPLHLHTEDDLYDIQKYSVFLDMLIILKTFGAVFRRKGAF